MIKRRLSNIWVKETPGGGVEFSTSSKVLFTVLPFLLAALIYYLLVVLEQLERGPEIIIILAYCIVVAVAMLTLLVVMISIIDYLRKFE